MTVKQLKQALDEFPDNLEVFVAERKTEFRFGLVNNVYDKLINFSEEPDSKPLAKSKVVVIDEE